MIAPLLLIVALASQPPTPSTGKSQGSQPQRDAAAAQPPTTNNPRGTDDAPLVIKIQPPTKTDGEPAKEQRQEDREASAHRWQIASVVATAFIGLLTLIAIGFQVGLLFRQNAILAGQSTLMNGQLKAATKSADATTDAVKLNRPFLDLVPVGVDEFVSGGRFGLQIVFDVRNFGQTAARLDEVLKRVWYWGAPDDRPHLPENPCSMISPSGTFRLRCYAGDMTPDLRTTFDNSERITVQIAGEIRYTDQFGDRHIKHFGWKCESVSGEEPVFTQLPRNDEADWGQKKEQGQS